MQYHCLRSCTQTSHGRFTGMLHAPATSTSSLLTVYTIITYSPCSLATDMLQEHVVSAQAGVQL